MAKKQATNWIVWDAENSTVQSVHADKKSAEEQIRNLTAQPGHEADNLSAVEVPSR